MAHQHEKSSNMRESIEPSPWRELFRGMVEPDEELSPIFPHTLLRTGNPAPKKPVPAEMLATLTSRFVSLRADSNKTGDLKLQESQIVPGMLELPQGVTFPNGIPGQRERILRTKGRPKERRSRTKQKRKSMVGAFIPDWISPGFHPIPVFYRAPTEIQTNDRRRLRLSQNHIQIYGPDNRINIFPTTYPENCVCRIEVSTRDIATGPWVFRQRGTGFIVGSRIMITSGHMRPPQPHAGWMIRVVPGYYDGNSALGSSFFSFASDYLFYQSDTGNDFMICRLYDPLGDTTGYFGAVEYDSDWQDRDVWSMCGYPYDRGDMRPTLQGAISVIDDDDGEDIELPNGDDKDTTEVESYADEASGASGSPLYSWFTDGHPYAVGVHHGREYEFLDETHSVASGGEGLVELIRWARSNWT